MHADDGRTKNCGGLAEFPSQILRLFTRVTIDSRALSEAETELTLTHEGFPDTEMRDKHNEGWEGCLSRLSAAL